MKRILALSIATTAAATFLAGTAHAQQGLNPNGTPNFGQVTLNEDFANDPRSVGIRAGGPIAANRTSSDCAGFVTRNPDYRVRYNVQGGNLPLIISVNSSVDTTLVVNAPDGQWYCDDDGGNGPLNPSVRFDNPEGGSYEVWVGTYNRGPQRPPAQLFISEVSSR